jgi:hypothetical protein
MTVTIELPAKVAERPAQIPEGEARDMKVAEWLEHGAGNDVLVEPADPSPLTEEENRLLSEGLDAADANRGRPVREALANFLLRREQERLDRKIAK